MEWSRPCGYLLKCQAFQIVSASVHINISFHLWLNPRPQDDQYAWLELPVDRLTGMLFRLFQTDPLFLKFSADPVYHNLDHFRLGPSLFRDTPQRRFHKKLRNSLLQPFKLHSSRHLGRYLWHFAFVYCRHLHSLSVCLSGHRLS